MDWDDSGCTSDSFRRAIERDGPLGAPARSDSLSRAMDSDGAAVAGCQVGSDVGRVAVNSADTATTAAPVSRARLREWFPIVVPWCGVISSSPTQPRLVCSQPTAHRG